MGQWSWSITYFLVRFFLIQVSIPPRGGSAPPSSVQRRTNQTFLRHLTEFLLSFQVRRFFMELRRGRFVRLPPPPPDIARFTSFAVRDATLPGGPKALSHLKNLNLEDFNDLYFEFPLDV